MDAGAAPIDDETGAPGARLGRIFTEQVQRLFVEREHTLGREITHAEVAQWLSDHDYKVTPGYISHLRTGRNNSPSFRLIEGLAEYFAVDSAVFLSEPHRSDALVESLRDEGVIDIAWRASGLPPRTIDAVRAILDNFRESEGLPPVEK